MSWLLLVPLWRMIARPFRSLWRWAGEVADHKRARRIQREAGREQAAVAAGFESARAQEEAERAERKETEKARREAQKALKRSERGRRAIEGLEQQRIRDARKLGINVELLSEYRQLGATAIGAKEALKLFRALSSSSPVIVRSYASMPGLRAEALMQIDAQVLANHGYFPTSQSFAAVNALTSLAGIGYLTVSYVRQAEDGISGPGSRERLVGEPTRGARGGESTSVPIEHEVSSTVDVLLTDVGKNKILVIKAIRDRTGLGLREAKDLVDHAPATVQVRVSREVGEMMREELALAGASSEVVLSDGGSHRAL